MPLLLNKIFAYKKVLAFILGGLAVQALPPFYHWYMLFISFSGLFYLTTIAHNKKQAFAYGYWFGFAYFAFGLFWVNNALLVNPEQTGWLIPVTFIASGAFFGLFIGLPTLLTQLNKSPVGKYLALSGWIVIFEWLRSWILTGFPWNLIGTTLAFNLNLIQLASVLGTYGLSLLILLATAAPALYRPQLSKKQLVSIACIPLAIFSFLYFYGNHRISLLQNNQDSLVKIRLVQPNIQQSVKWSADLREEHFQKHLQLSASQPLNDVSMVIWSETASPYPLDLNKAAAQKIAEILPPETYLTTGVIRYQDNYYGGWLPYNSSLVLNSSGKIEDFYDKTHLVPFGEYIPLRQWLPDFIRPVTNIIANLEAGSGPKIIKISSLPPFSIQICYEIIFPHQIIKNDEKPEWLINLTNDGWYGISSGPYQHLVAAQMRAVEEGLTIVRSAGSGISAVINRYGKIVKKLDLNAQGILDINLPQKLATHTFYNHWGNLFPLLLCLLNIFISLLFFRKNHQ